MSSAKTRGRQRAARNDEESIERWTNGLHDYLVRGGTPISGDAKAAIRSWLKAAFTVGKYRAASRARAQRLG